MVKWWVFAPALAALAGAGLITLVVAGRRR
jgi:hypothetical protein